jgi:hypothetical protein
MNSYFEELFNVNVNDKVEKKNGLSYVSWAFAWGELKKHFPKSFYTVYENENGWPYFTDGRTCWVKTGVTVVQSEVVRDPDGNLYGEDFGRLEHIEYLPIMDFRNNSIPADKVTSTDVNKAIQRSLTKAIARHGLGLYIYAGEDLPEEEKEAETKPITEKEAMILSNTLTPEQIEWVRKKYNVKKLAELNATQYGELMRTINDRENANGK